MDNFTGRLTGFTTDGFRKGRVLRHVSNVIKGMIFIGFTVQIALGLVWMCCNFGQVQDFGWRNLGRTEPGGAIYALYGFLGRIPPLLYLAQLGFALFAGQRFLCKAGKFRVNSRGRAVFLLWGSLALLTFPFAMQCYLAVLPYSAMSSLFLLMLSFLLEAVSGKRAEAHPSEEADETSGEADALGKTPGGGSGKDVRSGEGASGRLRWGIRLRSLAFAGVCGVLAAVLALEAGADEREAIWGRGTDAALASRLAWPSVWNDREYWPEELLSLTEEQELWRAAYCPGNMEIVLEGIRQRAQGAPEGFYRQMAETAWQLRRPMIVRQIAWDILGYGAFPLVFGMHMEGRAYDSYTGRNYETMRAHAPVLTKYYVKYGCWWFGCGLMLAFILFMLEIAAGGAGLRGAAFPLAVCALTGAAVALLYTMRGAGLMDYRCTVGVNQLWLAGTLCCACACGRPGEGKSGKEELR